MRLLRSQLPAEADTSICHAGSLSEICTVSLSKCNARNKGCVIFCWENTFSVKIQIITHFWGNVRILRGGRFDYWASFCWGPQSCRCLCPVRDRTARRTKNSLVRSAAWGPDAQKWKLSQTMEEREFSQGLRVFVSFCTVFGMGNRNKQCPFWRTPRGPSTNFTSTLRTLRILEVRIRKSKADLEYGLLP